METGVGGLNKVTPQSRKHEPVGFSARIEKLLSVAGEREADEALILLAQLVPAYTPPSTAVNVMRAS